MPVIGQTLIRIKCVNPNCKEKTDYFNYLSHIENCYFRLYHYMAALTNNLNFDNLRQATSL